MTDWAIIVHDLRLERGERQHEFAKAVGVSQATVSRWEKGRNKPSRDEARSIEELAGRPLAAPPAGLRDQGADPQPWHSVQQPPTVPLMVRDGGPTQPSLIYSEHIPPPGINPLGILGHGEGGNDGLFLDNGTPQGFTARPDYLAGATQAYAIFVHNDSMEPRYYHGEMLYVDPTLPPRPGDFVVVQTADDRAFVKRLKRRTQDLIVVEQFNPPKDIRFPGSNTQIHSIVGTRSVRR